jgi:hypothetical protein
MAAAVASGADGACGGGVAELSQPATAERATKATDTEEESACVLRARRPIPQNGHEGSVART